MGFFGKLKQMAGIGGVKLQVVPSASTFVRGGGTLDGSLIVTSKSDQKINLIDVKVQEIVHVKEGEHHREKEFDLGYAQVSGELEIKAGESKTIPFSVSYSGGRTMADKLQAKGGALGMVGKIGAMANHEKLEYRVHAHAKVVGAPLGSGHKVKLNPANA